MRFYSKRLAAIALAAITAFSAAPAFGGQNAIVAQAEEGTDQTEAAALLEGLKGTYQQLFTGGLFEEKYAHYWHDFCAAVVGEEQVDACVTIMKAAVGSDKYGADAVEGAFCCDFINGVKNVTFDGNTFTVALEDGSTQSHTYEFVRKDSIGGIMPGFIFKSTDDNEDEFKYFFLCGDTPGATYHAEFRYGSDLDDLLKYNEGKYANWLVGAIEASAFADEKEVTIQHVTALFCVENLKEMAGDAAAAQRQPLVGTWDADMTDFHKIPEYANASLYCVLNADGTGSTYLDLAGTGDFLNTDNYQFFAYDNDGNAETNSGVYLPANEAEGSVSAGYYALTKKDGKDVLTFTTPEGEVISYIRREAEKTDDTTNTDSSNSNTKVTSFSSGNLKYQVLSGGKKVQVTGTVKKAKTVTIPATVKDGNGTSYKVTAIAKSAFKKDTTVTSVTIGKNVTTIGVNAFRGNTKLKTITIKGSSLKKIGKKAFTGVPKKATAKVPKKQKAAYKKLLKNAGFKGTVK